MSSERDPDERLPIIPPNLIEHIPEENRADFIREYVLHIEHIEQYSGPIPHPRIFASYVEIMPESGDRILTMAEEQQKRRMKSEEDWIGIYRFRLQYGMWLGFVLALALIICGTLIILSGHDVAGFAVVTAPAITIAGVFIYNQRRRKD